MGIALHCIVVFLLTITEFGIDCVVSNRLVRSTVPTPIKERKKTGEGMTNHCNAKIEREYC